MHYGVDTSNVNAHPIDWAALYAYLAGLGGEQPFAILKATEGVTYTDPDFQSDLAAAKAAGFAVGAYLFDHGDDDPASEEAAFRRVVAGIPQFDDIESPDGLSSAAYAAHVAQLVAQAPGIDYLNQSEVAEGIPEGTGLWLAQYNGDPGVTAYPCIIHQYTSSGTVPGCAGQFDLDCWCGTEAQFSSTFSLAPAPAPTPPPEVPMPGVSDFKTTPNGTRHRASIFIGVPGHYWSPADMGWFSENLAAKAGLTGVSFDPDQTPSVQVTGGVLTIAAVDTGGTPYEFLQLPGESSWSVAPLIG